MRYTFIEDYILFGLTNGRNLTRKGLLNKYKTADVHNAIWSLIEQGRIQWDDRDYDTLLLIEADETCT